MQADWRERLMKQTSIWFGLAGLTISILATTALAGQQAHVGAGLLAGLLGLCALAVAFLKIPARTRAVAFVVVAFLASLYGYAFFAFLSGPALVAAAAVLFAGLLLGKRAVVMLVIGLGLCVAVIGWAMVTGRLSGPPPELSSPQSPLAWARTTIISCVFWTTLGLSLAGVIRALEESAHKEREAVEQLRAEQVKRAQADQERAVAERIAVSAQKMEAVGRLAAGVAHDFNNALQVIQSWNELSNEADATADDRADAAEAIRTACGQARGLAKQLLVLSRSSARTPHDVSLGALLASTMKTLRRVIPEDLTLVHESTGDVWVHADEVQLQQIVLNLALNARDAAHGGGTVFMRTREELLQEARTVATGELPPGRYAVVEIEDTGAGMTPETLARAFEPFFSTKTPSKGTGLGLATVRAVVAEHAGHIDLWSELGKGTRVSVFLQAAQTQQGRRLATPLNVAAAGVAGRVLLVEDNVQVRALFERTLRSSGHTVELASNGDEALTAIAANKFDLLCTDAVMPGAPLRQIVDAFETANPKAPILVCSGYVEEEITRRGIEQGRYQLLRKPFQPGQLVRAVNEALYSRNTALPEPSAT
jgi:signal transduction histidine kinase/CheY-like chemotaxis protein